MDAGSDCQQDTSLCAELLRCRLDPGLLSAATSSIDEMATWMVDIANRIGQLEANIVTELESTGLIDTKVRGKPG